MAQGATTPDLGTVLPARPIAGEKPTPRSATWEWLLCGLLLSATMLNYADRQTLPTAAVRVKRDLNLTNAQYGAAEGVFGLAFGAGALFAGVAADRLSVRWLYPAAVLGWSLAGMICGWAETFAALWASRLALGLLEAGHWPCALRTTQRVFAPGRRPLANSLLQAGAPLGAILTPLLMLALITEQPGSWRPMFWIIGLLGLPWAGLWIATVRHDDLLRDVPRDTGARPALVTRDELPLTQLLLSRRFLLLLGITISLNTAWHYIRVWMPLVLEERMKYRSAAVQQFFILYWLATFAGSISSGWLASRLVLRGWAVHSARIGVLLAGALLTALGVVAAFLPAGSPMLASLLVVGFGCLGMFPAYYSLTQELTLRHQGVVCGTLGAVAWAVLYFVHPQIGALLDHNPAKAPFVFAAVELLPLLAIGLVAAFWGRDAL